jgi:hypothetical protein
MARIFIKIAEYPVDDNIRKRIEKERENRLRIKQDLSRLKTARDVRDYWRYRALGSWNKSELDHKYGI